MGKRIRLQRLGRHSDRADLEVSCAILDVMQGADIELRVIVDCGAYTEHEGDNERIVGPDLTPLKDGRRIDAVLVTHAHHDHMGCLPALVPFLAADAKFHMTLPTAMAIRHTYRMELDSRSRKQPQVKPYSPAHVREVERRIREILTAGEHFVTSGQTAWVWPAGHISGACSFTLPIGGKLVHFTGDRCDHDQPGVLGAPALPDAWRPQIVAGSDCTYGGATVGQPNWRSEMDRAAELCSRALADDRRVMFYAFSLHRGGALAHELQRLGLAEDYLVYLDGSAAAFAKMFTTGRHSWCDRDRPFIIDRVNLIDDRRYRERVRDQSGGYVIIAPPGMGGPGGIGTWWRRELLADPDAVVAFTGYVAAGTDGEKILQAAAEREANGGVPRITFRETDIRGRDIDVTLPLRCQVEHFRLGGHNDRAGTVQWFRDVRPEIAVLSHGSPDSLASVEAELKGSIGRLVRADLEPVVEIDL